MSFDAKTGHFVLSVSKASLAFRIEENDTEAIATRLQESGIDVHEVCPAWIRCDMRPAAIWRAFHGDRPEPSLIAHHWTATARAMHPIWAEEELAVHASVASDDAPSRI